MLNQSANPFSLGTFTGARLRGARMAAALAGVLSAATAYCAGMAASEWLAILSERSCRVAVMDARGHVYIIGEGDTFAAAIQGAVMPDDRHILMVEDCYR